MHCRVFEVFHLHRAGAFFSAYEEERGKVTQGSELAKFCILQVNICAF